MSAFNSDPVEAIRFIRDKLDVPSASWTDLWQQQHSVAFTVAGAQSEALVRDFHDAVNRAIANGTTLDDFRRDFDRIVAEHGWSYNGSRGWRSRVIFDTTSTWPMRPVAGSKSSASSSSGLICATCTSRARRIRAPNTRPGTASFCRSMIPGG